MRIRIVDAFTDKPFSGAPAGVLLLDAFPSDDWMQRVAAEVNHAETAFLHPLPEGGDADWALRWFTPAVEVALCGHATLAAAHVLNPAAPIRFATRSGVLRASVDDGLITLDFPTAPLTRVSTDPALAAALGVGSRGIVAAGIEAVGVEGLGVESRGGAILAVHHTGPDTDDLLVEVADEQTVRTIVPDLRALIPLSGRGVIVTAVADPGAGHDFVSRFFGPAVGVDEDPVTGSAHTALAPYWSARLGRTDLTGYQASPRGGYVQVSLRGERTLLRGRAVTVIDGELLAPVGEP
ncbi:PhzF family phenazine biosynthesis protein [Actinoplanes lutulentus]|uniref:PhzF family phenazine biosynthesis protein n=1 Tax=Actinoplanes lutulentus TaxID=1287878 RepID=A0A327YZ18_9ACTN|nr:PhzF family phenazine biosynthesis protein [Actinoplanes lutulentus]MBB2942054.1 PhzF family phenazine biosynthesis protein [Actinoplanes lutulentus]RAK26992.1 PhzF family phenazine biosynthesis protein [Actinoplanes lutulentus]